ncbi:hypothetical protein EWI07_01095 [Sporolactobacillus sp. THM7-4]|nr:hypothetical protein EWI07_01095 [Sporolactobacillus sp. THM7-4]
MEFVMGNRTLQINQPTVLRILQIINDYKDDHHYLSHLIADGEEVYDQFESYLEKHVQEIKKLVVVTKTVDEFIDTNLQLAKNYLIKAIPLLSELSQSFYQAPLSGDWHTLNDLFTGIEWLGKMEHAVEQTKKKPIGWSSLKESLAQIQQQLKEMEIALKNKDQVLIADLLQYEMLPLFMQLAESINRMSVGEKHP